MSKVVKNIIDERFNGGKPIIADRDESELSVRRHCLVIQSDTDLADGWGKDYSHLRGCWQEETIKLVS